VSSRLITVKIHWHGTTDSHVPVSSHANVRSMTRQDLKTLMEAAILYGMVIRAILIIHAALDGERIIDIRHNPSRQSP